MTDPAAPRRVLVIDDEESLRHALSKGLARAGFVVETAATGREGIDRFRDGGFAAVLTDVRLPDLTGLDVVAVLTETDADVPVVVMTGYGSVDTALEAMRRGAKDYVQKPFTAQEVVQVLEKAIAGHAAGREERRLRARVERRFQPEGFTQVEAELKARSEPAPPPAAGPAPLREAQRAFEVRYVEDLLARTGGNVAAAARLAGISRPNFHKKLRTLGVDPARYKRAARRGRREGP